MTPLEIYQCQLERLGSRRRAFNSLSEEVKKALKSQYDYLPRNQNKLRALYRKKVKEYTERNSSRLAASTDRGFFKYHIDHIVPIEYGYNNGIPPWVMGSEENLQVLYWKDNIVKKDTLTRKAKELLRKWGLL